MATDRKLIASILDAGEGLVGALGPDDIGTIFHISARPWSGLVGMDIGTSTPATGGTEFFSPGAFVWYANVWSGTESLPKQVWKSYATVNNQSGGNPSNYVWGLRDAGDVIGATFQRVVGDTTVFSVFDPDYPLASPMAVLLANMGSGTEFGINDPVHSSRNLFNISSVSGGTCIKREGEAPSGLGDGKTTYYNAYTFFTNSPRNVFTSFEIRAYTFLCVTARVGVVNIDFDHTNPPRCADWEMKGTFICYDNQHLAQLGVTEYPYEGDLNDPAYGCVFTVDDTGKTISVTVTGEVTGYAVKSVVEFIPIYRPLV